MKTYVIALTTFREIIRWPMFWLLFLIAAFMLVSFVFTPYFTLGEDIKMVMDQGLAVIMVTGLIIALFSASVSISEEIEGKTAITLLSKPINRRHFIIGKFGGIMSAVLVLFLMLGIIYLAVLVYKGHYDAREYASDKPTWAQNVVMIQRMIPGLVLTYFQVTILTALSVAFSTRFPVHWNISLAIIIFLLGHLSHWMVQLSTQDQTQNEAVTFIAKLFATVLPGLEYFNVGPAISTESWVPAEYLLLCFGYCALYTTVAILLGLLMFEDRDLA
jgi:ABC-type transport system involved in multi-copper enzyme maturation permease subunit